MTRSLLSSIVSTDHATHNLIANKKREMRNEEKFTTYHQEKTVNDYSARTCVRPCGEDQHRRYQTDTERQRDRQTNKETNSKIWDKIKQ